MANTNGTHQQKLQDDLFEYFEAKKYKNVAESCKKHRGSPLLEIGIYGDTVLHMAARSKQKDLALELLNMLPEDLKHELAGKKNEDGNTILHEVATSNDMKDVAEMLCNHRELLTARNDSGETPIFCAARHGQNKMFKFLAKEMKLKELSEEDVKQHLQRDDRTTVLHVSITTECFGLAKSIAKRYAYLIEEKDQDSMTALQYLACNPSAFVTRSVKIRREFMEISMNSKKKLGFIHIMSGVIEALAISDWSLLKTHKMIVESDHLDKLIKILIEKDTSWNAGVENPLLLATTLNIKHEDPLFLATISNISEIVRTIISCHPRALEHTNKEGMNILQVAILYRHIEIFDMVIKKFKVHSRRLLSTRDNNGNSLLHMVGQKRKSQVSEKLQSPALQLQKELLLFEKVKKACKVHVTKPLNKEKKTAEELFATSNEKLHQEAKEWLMRTTENCTILSVFIATVAFAAAYTVPGGPDQSTGIPILHSKPFFLVFIIADVISLTLALTSVGIFLSIITSSFPLGDFKKHLFKKLIQGIICLILSVSMMAVAFGATIILIMKHNSQNIVWHVVAFLPVLIFFLSYSPLRSAVLRTDIIELAKKVGKSIIVVVIVVVVFLLGLIIRLYSFCKKLHGIVAKAWELICKCVGSICGNKSPGPQSDTQSPQQTAAHDHEEA